MFETKDYRGSATGIIRKISDDWKIFPPRECMRSAGLLPNTFYMTIMLRDGGIALIPYNMEEEEKDEEG